MVSHGLANVERLSGVNREMRRNEFSDCFSVVCLRVNVVCVRVCVCEDCDFAGFQSCLCFYYRRISPALRFTFIFCT